MTVIEKRRELIEAARQDIHVGIHEGEVFPAATTDAEVGALGEA